MTSLRSVLMFLAACGGDTSDPSAPDAGEHISSTVDAAMPMPGPTICQQAKDHSDFAWLQEHVFTPSCATAMCHGGPEPEVGLNLSAGAAYNNLVNKGASTVTGWTRVVPGKLTESYLAVSLGRAEGPPPRDGYMPLGADALCLEKLQAIERWILLGANP